VQAGDKLPTQAYQITRADLIRYAGASLDFNPIHWSDRVAAQVGLPGVLAHGMYTMAIAGRALTVWAGDPGAVAEYGVRFARPVVVPDADPGTEVEVTGVVREVDEHRLATVDLTVTCAGERVLVQARAVLRLGSGPDTGPAPGG
jgi:acyl dehydratase